MKEDKLWVGILSEFLVPLLWRGDPLVIRTSFARILALGRLTQRLEYFVYTEGVGDSNPSSPTLEISDARLAIPATLDSEVA